jgi:hypothetical protein
MHIIAIQMTTIITEIIIINANVIKFYDNRCTAAPIPQLLFGFLEMYMYPFIPKFLPH